MNSGREYPVFIGEQTFEKSGKGAVGISYPNSGSVHFLVGSDQDGPGFTGGQGAPEFFSGHKGQISRTRVFQTRDPGDQRILGSDQFTTQ
jgi:hypothetical protein